MVVQRQNPAYRLARGFQKAPVRELFCFMAHPPANALRRRFAKVYSTLYSATSSYIPKMGTELMLDPHFIACIARMRSIRANGLAVKLDDRKFTARQIRRRFLLRASQDRRSRNRRRRRRSRRSPSRRWKPQERPSRWSQEMHRLQRRPERRLERTARCHKRRSRQR